MKFSYYLVFSLIFTIISFIVAYFISQESYDIGFGVALPIALWVITPLIIFFLLSFIFFGMNSIKAFLNNANYGKDYKLFLHQILNPESNNLNFSQKFKTPFFNDVSKALTRFNIKPNLESSQSGIEKIDSMFDKFNKINNGEYEELKSCPYKDIEDKNTMLFMNENPKNAMDILKDSTKSLEIRANAFLIIIKSKNLKDIQKALNLGKSCLNKNVLMHLFAFMPDLNISPEEFAKMARKIDFQMNDYIDLARFVKGEFSPNQWLEMFKSLNNYDEAAHKAYVYVLLELDLLDAAKSELKNNHNRELDLFRAYVDLKALDKNYILETFL